MVCGRGGELSPGVLVIGKRNPIPIMALRYANGFPPNNVMLCDGDRTCVLGVDGLERKPDGLANCGDDREDFDPFGNRDELGERCECIPGGPSLVGKEDIVHQLPRPSVLYLRRLLVFERIRSKGTEYHNWQEGMEVMG